MNKKQIKRIKRDVTTYLGTGRESTELVLALLDALTPPETLAECEAVAGEPEQGHTSHWMEYLPDQFEFRVNSGVTQSEEKNAQLAAWRLEAAQRAVICKRVFEWMEGRK